MTTVRELRSRTGLTQKEFSAKYYVPIKTIADWENGRHTPQEYIVNLLERFVEEDSDKDFVLPIMYNVNYGILLDITRMTKTDFARRYGISESTICNWKKEEKSWKTRLLERAVR